MQEALSREQADARLAGRGQEVRGSYRPLAGSVEQPLPFRLALRQMCDHREAEIETSLVELDRGGVRSVRGHSEGDPL